MFLHGNEPVRFSCAPVLETMLLTESEIQDLFSLINQPADPASPSSGSSRSVYSAEERKMRRMQANRESARRSRCKRKKHLEKLTSQVNRLRIENREMKNLVAFSVQEHLLLSLHNDELRSESMTLLAELSDLYAILGTTLLH